MNVQSKAGFSFIELVIAVTIMAILALIAGPVGYTYLKKTKKNTTVSTLKTLETAIDSFHADAGSYPNTLSELITRPSDEKTAKRWEGPYIKKEVTDGYGNNFEYRVTKGGKHPYELYSWGPNGEGSPEEEWINVWDI